MQGTNSASTAMAPTVSLAEVLRAVKALDTGATQLREFMQERGFDPDKGALLFAPAACAPQLPRVPFVRYSQLLTEQVILVHAPVITCDVRLAR